MLRREFVRVCGLAIVSMALGAAGIASGEGKRGRRTRVKRTGRPEQGIVPGSSASFEGQVGQWFYIDDGQMQHLQLTSVEPGPESEGLDQFSLYFHGHLNVEIDEGLYPVQSDQGEVDELFIQPVGEDEQGRVYMAPFAQLQPTS